jgi:NADH-quinone oxidoreductase subunit M
VDWVYRHLLSLIVFFPLLGVAVLICVDRSRASFIKWFALAVSLVVLGLTIWLWVDYARSGWPAMELIKGKWHVPFEEQAPWIPSLNVSYHLGADGLSIPLIFLTALLSSVSILYSFYINERPKEYFILFLLLQMGMTGVFVALDFFLFYVFWEVSLVPMYFLIGVWGGPRREYAAIKFFIYTLVGSLTMLLAMLALYFASNPHTLDILRLAAQNPMLRQPFAAQSLVFWGIFLAFAIKVPMWPFHTWLPDAHVEAPTAGSIILAGVLLKLGGYGFIRVLLPILPQASMYYAWVLGLLAVIAVIYGALVAMAQRDVKKLIAYSSVNHMGYVMLGIAVACVGAKTWAPGQLVLAGGAMTAKLQALQGAVLQMFNHGIITGALFLLVGVIYERAHTRDLQAFGGLGVKMPVYYTIMATACLASLGLPGLAGFVSEFYVFVGSFSILKLLTCLSVIGVIVTAAYLLWTIQRLFLGPLKDVWRNITDMNAREVVSVLPLVGFMIAVGVWPLPFLNTMQTTLQQVIKLLGFSWSHA